MLVGLTRENWVRVAATSEQEHIRGALEMGTDPLTYKDLRAAVEGTAAAFRAVTDLDPAGGDGDKLFPPTYQGGMYAREVRINGGQPTPCVLLDSVQSQANRLYGPIKPSPTNNLRHSPRSEGPAIRRAR
jgi:hypothetical protein